MEELHRRLIMSLAPVQRLRMACGMFETAKILAAAGLRADASRRRYFMAAFRANCTRQLSNSLESSRSVPSSYTL